MPGYIDLRRFRKVIKEEAEEAYSQTPAYSVEQIRYNVLRYKDRENMELYIKNYNSISPDPGAALDIILKLIGEVSAMTNNLNQSDYIYFCNLIKSTIAIKVDPRGLLLYCENALSNTGLESMPILVAIVNDLKIFAETRLKINTVQENHIKLDKKIGISQFVKEINERNPDYVTDSIHELCEMIISAYPNIPTIKKYGVCMESILYASILGYKTIKHSDILETITEYFVMKVADNKDIPYIGKAIIETQFYQEADKKAAIDILDNVMLNEGILDFLNPMKLVAKITGKDGNDSKKIYPYEAFRYAMAHKSELNKYGEFITKTNNHKHALEYVEFANERVKEESDRYKYSLMSIEEKGKEICELGYSHDTKTGMIYVVEVMMINKKTKKFTAVRLAENFDKPEYMILEGPNRKVEELVNESAASILSSAILLEKKLSTAELNELPDHMFGIPRDRSFPLKDKAHVHSAMSYFHTAKEADRKLLARNILKRAKELKMPINKDTQWYKYIKENNVYLGDDVIFEASNDGIKQILLTLRQGSGDAAKQVKDVSVKIFAKPVDNVIDETPDILGFIRRFLIIGGAFAYNPYIGIVVGLADFVISHEANREQTSKVISSFEREKRSLEKKLKKSTDPEKSKGYKEAIEVLEKKIDRMLEYKESLMTSRERDKMYGYSEIAYANHIISNTQKIQEMLQNEDVLTEGTVKDLVTMTKESIKKGMSKMSAADRSASNALDSAVAGITRSIERALTSDKREAIVKGEIIPSLSKIVKIAIVVGAAWAVEPAIAVIGLVGGLVISKKATEKEREYLLSEIDVELKITEAKIEQAKSANDHEAYAQLLKIQKKLQGEQYRIKYNARARVDDRDHGSASSVKIKGGDK